MSKQYRPDALIALVRPPVRLNPGHWPSGQSSGFADIAIIVVFAIAARASTFFLSAIDWDEGVYIVMAQQWRSGHLPYVTVWDQHPPGLPAFLAVFQALIPDPVLSARLLGTLAVAITAIVINMFGTKYLKYPKLGLIGALLYLICISRFGGIALNTELVNSAIVSSASYLLFTASQNAVLRIQKAVMAAFLLGVGLQVKYVILPEAIIICSTFLLFLWKRGLNIPTIIGTGFILIFAGVFPTIVAVGYFWSQGLLDAFVDANVRANVAYLSIWFNLPTIYWNSLSGLEPLFGPMLLIAFVIGRRLLYAARQRSPGAFEIWLTIWILACTLDICLPLKFYPHYFFALYPPVCLAAMRAMDLAVGQHRRSWVACAVVLFLSAVPLWSAGIVRAARANDIPRAFAQVINDSKTAERSVYVYNYQPVIYALAQVRPPTPYVIHAELAQFSQSANVDGPGEVNRIMRSAPLFLVVKQRVPGSEIDPLMDALTPYLPRYEVASELSEANGERVRLYRKIGMP